jgi:hypothetical protein
LFRIAESSAGMKNEGPSAKGIVIRKYSDEKLSSSLSMDTFRPLETEKLATKNMVHNAMPQLVDLALELNLNSGRRFIGDRPNKGENTI